MWKELSGEIVIIGREMHPDGTTCDKFAKLRLFKTCANLTQWILSLFEVAYEFLFIENYQENIYFFRGLESVCDKL